MKRWTLSTRLWDRVSSFALVTTSCTTRKNPIIAKEVPDGYVIAALQYVLSKDGGFVPAAYIEHYVRSENGMDTTTGKVVELASARPEPDFEKLRALTFEVDVDELVKIGESIKVKH